MKNFFSGLAVGDFEKITLGFLLICCVIVTLVVYCKRGIIDSNIVYLASMLGSLFVVRKGLKYNADIKSQQITVFESENNNDKETN